MPDFDRTPGGEPSLDDIRRSDSFIDALAGGAPIAPADQADAALAALLGTWRDESRWPPDAGLISEPQAIAALDAGLAEKRTGINRDKWVPTTGPAKRSRRGLSVVGAAAAAMLCIGGFGAVVSGAGPGDSLYGLRTMLFGAPKQVRDDQVALAARTEMQQVQELISRGDWQQAEQKLVSVSNQVSGIGDVEQKQQLLDQFNNLSAKVVKRDPEATPPPGITYTVPPSATELVPATVPPTSAPSSASAQESGTSSPESASPSAASTTPTSVPSSPASTAVSTSAAATSAPSSTSAAATSAPSSSSATSATQQSQATTTPTSATPTTTPPTTTPPTTTTTAPKSSASTTSGSATSTTAPAAAATTSTTAPAAAATTSTTAPAAAATSSTGTGTTVSSTAVTTPATAAGTAAATSTPAATSTAAPVAGGGKTTAGGVGTSQQPVVIPTTTTVVIPVPVPAG